MSQSHTLQEQEESDDELDLAEREKMSKEMRERMKEGGFGELLRCAFRHMFAPLRVDRVSVCVAFLSFSFRTFESRPTRGAYTMHIYMYVCVYMCVCVYVCMYVYVYIPRPVPVLISGDLRRSKGTMWLASCHSHAITWSQSGLYLTLKAERSWCCELPECEWGAKDESQKERIKQLVAQSKYGDRRQELVFIGVGLKKVRPSVAAAS